jgi:hypothetical protein
MDVTGFDVDVFAMGVCVLVLLDACGIKHELLKRSKERAP